MIPQAILSVPLAKMAKRLGSKITNSYDNLDGFEGVAAKLHRLRFTVTHRPGYPRDTSIINLPMDIKNLGELTEQVSAITEAFGLPQDTIVWQRRDGPEL